MLGTGVVSEHLGVFFRPCRGLLASLRARVFHEWCDAFSSVENVGLTAARIRGVCQTKVVVDHSLSEKWCQWLIWSDVGRNVASAMSVFHFELFRSRIGCRSIRFRRPFVNLCDDETWIFFSILKILKFGRYHARVFMTPQIRFFSQRLMFCMTLKIRNFGQRSCFRALRRFFPALSGRSLRARVFYEWCEALSSVANFGLTEGRIRGVCQIKVVSRFAIGEVVWIINMKRWG